MSSCSKKFSPFALTVDCYDGYRGQEEPRRFSLGDKPVDIAEILDRWISPDHRYFKVKSTKGDIYILRHDIHTQIWELTLFEDGVKGPCFGSSGHEDG